MIVKNDEYLSSLLDSFDRMDKQKLASRIRRAYQLGAFESLVQGVSAKLEHSLTDEQRTKLEILDQCSHLVEEDRAMLASSE